MSKTLPLLVLLLSLGAFAQTTTTYESSTGKVSPSNQVTGNLDLGGSFVSAHGMGAGCYYGGCPDWTFFNYPLSYALQDGTTANFTNFSGSANFSNQFDIKVDGTASGYDNTGAPVSISVHWDFQAKCRSGRGGGCTKVFLDGALSVTK
jgi:hypothetical protein